MITQPFAPVLTVNRVYNAMLRCSVLDGLWQRGQLVRARPMLDGRQRWAIDVPPGASSAVVDEDVLAPITTAELPNGEILRAGAP